MTDIAIAPSPAPGQDEQSVHLYTIRDNTPAWYTESPAELKLQMALMPLTIAQWFRYASEPARESLRQVHERSRKSLNYLDKLLFGLKNAAAFAEPLLVEAIEKKFGLRLNVKRVFYARKMELTECERLPGEVARSSAAALGPKFYFYKGVSLLEAALSNFTEDEATAPVCKDCHLMTLYDFYRRPAQAQPPPGDVKSLPVGIKAHEFARMCRDLNLGATYYTHVRSILNALISPSSPGAASGQLYGAMITAHRNQLELAAQIAVMQQDIAQDSHALIKDILINQSGRQWGGEAISFSRYKLCRYTLEGILIIGAVAVRHNVRNVTVQPRRCLVYIPGDPQHVLKEYPSIAQFTDHLTTRLCRAEYRVFFSQFVPISEHEGFFKKLKAMLDPKDAFTSAEDFDVASKSRINNTADYDYGVPLKDVWLDSAVQKVRLIMANCSSIAVSTQAMDQRVYYANLSWWGSKALDVLNLAAFVVPVLGEIMLAVGALQLCYELADGVESWLDGEAQEAWQHFSGVMLGVAGLAVPKVLTAGANSAFVKRLVRVEFGAGKVRLHDTNLAAFTHPITLPAQLKPDARGLYVHEGESYWPVEGGYYKIGNGGDGTRLVHPDGASRYSPLIRHNGGGGWVHEFEQPLTWDRRTLLRRIGHSVDALSDSQLEQLRVMSGVSDDELRRIYIDQQLPSPLFREGLRHFEYHQKYQALLDNLRSPDPAAVERVDGYTQLKLIKREGAWPRAKGVEVRDASGNTVWHSADATAEKPIVVLSEDEVLAGRILRPLLMQLDLAEARQLLGEAIPLDTLTFDFMGGKFEQPLPAHLQRPVRVRALEVPSDTKRLANYQRRLQQLADEHRHELVGDDIAAGNLSSDPDVQMVQRAFPGLPKPVVEELLAHANREELAHMAQNSRLPLRLAEEARRYLQRVRIMQAHAVLLFDGPLTMDAVQLALHTLAAIPGKLATGIELRAGTENGPLLAQVGKADAINRFQLVRISMKHWEVHDGTGNVLYSRSDAGAFYSALWFASGGKFTDWAQLKTATQHLKTELLRQPLSDAAARRALGLQPIKPGFKSPMRLADGRFGYPLSPVGGNARRPSACELAAATVYPAKTLEEVEAFLGLEGRGDAQVLARLTELGHEYRQLQTTLAEWVEASEAGYARDRRRVAATIESAWRRSSPQALAADQTPIGHVLNLADEVIGELPPITANMDHVGHLRLSRMALSDASLPFLQAFGGLRWLNMEGNNFTRLPDFANGGARLTKLILSGNDIQLTEHSRTRLQAMHHLKILSLSNNRRLGWTADLRGMRSLNQLGLRNTGTTTFPVGAEQLTNLAFIDLHSNQITVLPEYAYQHPSRVNVHENPLANTLAQFQREAPVNQAQWADHVAVGEAREFWLSGAATDQRLQRGLMWDSLSSNPESAAFFTVLADTTRSAEYRSAVTRVALAERVWDMLEAARDSQGIRESLFSTADDRITCGDGSSVEFMNLESELMAARALESAGQDGAEGQLITTARQLFRLHLVDAIAQRDVDARGPGFTEQVEVILAYRTRLADRLGLPVKSRSMLFPRQANVSQAAIDEAYAQVLRDEGSEGDENAFFVGREFWQKHLRQHYPQALVEANASGIQAIDEQSAALFDLSDLQGEPSADDDWQARHTQAVDTLMRVLGKRRDEILVGGVMQSAFYERELKRLGDARQALDTQALLTLTRKVLNTFAAKQAE